MEYEQPIKFEVYTDETSHSLTTPEAKRFYLAINGCDAEIDDQSCRNTPRFIILYDLKGFVTNPDGSLEMWNITDVPVMACSEEHALSILATLIPDSENLARNFRTITVEKWLNKSPE